MTIIGDSEPSDGNRFREVKSRLKEALRDPIVFQMVERDCYDTTGLQLTEEFMSYLEVTSALFALPYYQRRALVLSCGPSALNQEQIGCRMGIAERTVREYCRVGIETMVVRIYPE